MVGNILELVAEIAGDEAGRKLTHAFGGQRIYVPSSLGPDHRLARAVGLEVAQMICREIGPGHIHVPTGAGAARNALAQQIEALDVQGLSANQIAETVNCSERTVRRHRSRIRAQGER